MKPGRMNRQVTVERKVKSTDPEYGTQTVTWEPLAYDGSPVSPIRFWAEVVDVLPSREEGDVQGLTLNRNQTRIRMRWRDDITSDMRILVHTDGTDRVYQIISGPADMDGRKSMIEMICERFTG